MVSHVRQQHAYGCQVATAAMILGVTYEEALALYELTDGGERLNESGLSATYLEFVLYDLGYSLRTLHRARRVGEGCSSRTPEQERRRKREQWPPEPWTDVHWCEVSRAVNGYGHCVVMLRDGTVLDPATAEPGRLSDYQEVLSVRGVEPPRCAI